jgi:hypothetical protein
VLTEALPLDGPLMGEGLGGGGRGSIWSETAQGEEAAMPGGGAGVGRLIWSRPAKAATSNGDARLIEPFT